MSHFCVIVIGPDHEGQLAPYDENLQVESRREAVDVDGELVPMLRHYQTQPPSAKSKAGQAIRMDNRMRLAKQDIDPETSPMLDTLSIVVTDGVLIEPSHTVVVALYRAWSNRDLHRDAQGYYAYTRYNEKSQWDWYSVGGRWAGYFKLKAGHAGTVGEPGVFNNSPEPGWVDVCRKGAVDTEGMRAAAGTHAGEEWDRVHTALAGHPPIETWDAVATRIAGPRIPGQPPDPARIDMARKVYHAQPGVQALSELLGPFMEDRIAVTERDAWVAAAAARALVPFAVVKDGAWFERGRMGWWGSVSGEKDEATWVAEFNALWDALPDDAELTLVDCHI